MKNYKRILFLAVMVFLCSSCNEDGCGGDRVYLRSYINFYTDGPIELLTKGYTHEKNQIGLRFSYYDVNGEPSTVYYAPEVGKIGNEKFLKIAERNGDRSYNRDEIRIYYSAIDAYAHNFKSMDVVCTNAAWDATHPAGTPLNDLVTINYHTYKEYIRNGYNDSEDWAGEFRQKLSDLKEDDLAMLTYDFDIYFDKLPVAGSYEIKVTMITTENMEKVATCTFKVE